ncbi:MAG: hypothetical protein ABW189_00500 [Rickettsiales bacterium]
MATPSTATPDAPSLARRVYALKKDPTLEVRCGSTPDMVRGEFRIDVSKPLPSLSDEFADAYEARDVRTEPSDPRPDGTLYALVMKNRRPTRLKTMNRLCGIEIPHFSSLYAHEILPFSAAKGGMRMALILRRPVGESLAAYIEKHGPQSERDVENFIVRPLHEALSIIQERGALHGGVNPHNIYVTPGRRITLRECFTRHCGAGQPDSYECAVRAGLPDYAKGETGAENADYYALGALAACALKGEVAVHPSEYERQYVDLADAKCAVGGYALLRGKLRLSQRFEDFLRGTLNENPRFVWSSRETQEWIAGRRFNLLAPKMPLKLARPIMFNGHKYHNLRHLCYGFAKNWEEAKLFVAHSDSVRWLERSIDNDAVTEKLFILQARFEPEEQRAVPKTPEEKTPAPFVMKRNDEVLAQLLFLLDPESPACVKQYRLHVSALGETLAEAFLSDDAGLRDAAAAALNVSLLSAWTEQQPEYRIVGMEDAIFALRRLVAVIHNPENIYGLPRALYDLHPGVPCLDPIFANNYVLCAEEALLAFNAPGATPDYANLSAHLAAFVASRINLYRPPKLDKLKKFPEFTSHPWINGLTLMAAAQRSLRFRPLKTLCAETAKQIDGPLELIRGKTIKKKFRDMVERGAETGLLFIVLEVLCHRPLHMRDKVGFEKAKEEYRHNAMRILHLSDPALLRGVGSRYGLSLCVIFSYLLAAAVFTILLVKTF